MDIHQKLYDTIISGKGTYKKVKQLFRKGAYTGVGLSALKEMEKIVGIDNKQIEVASKYLIKDLTGLVQEYGDRTKYQRRTERIRKLLLQIGAHDWAESLRWGYCTGNKVVVKYITKRGITIPARERDKIKNTEYYNPEKRELQDAIRKLQDRKSSSQRMVECLERRGKMTREKQEIARTTFERIEREIASLRERLENL